MVMCCIKKASSRLAFAYGVVSLVCERQPIGFVLVELLIYFF